MPIIDNRCKDYTIMKIYALLCYDQARKFFSLVYYHFIFVWYDVCNATSNAILVKLKISSAKRMFRIENKIGFFFGN